MVKKYNRHGNARERYLWEWHCNRIFKSYLDCDYKADGDKAMQNGYKSWQLKHVPSFQRHFTFKGVQYFIVRENHADVP